MQRVPTTGTFCGMQETYPAETVPEDGVTGNGEELAQTLEKVVSQLDVISRTLHVLEQRVSINEESVSGVMEYFREVKEAKASAKNDILQYNHQNLLTAQLGQQQEMRYNIE